jgi:hypothetical protein
MAQSDSLTRATLRTPKAAAIAGIIFSVLMTLIFVLFRISVPGDPLEPGAWLATSTRSASIALNLVPFAGVAFLWFIGVLRDRLGEQEDRFFATVFFGSALVFLATFFLAAATIGAVILTASSAAAQAALIDSAAFHLARASTYVIINIYSIKMAAVFMFSTSTVIIYTAIVPRWIAVLGFGLALFLLVGSYFLSWSVIVLPVWVMVISVYILMHNMRGTGRAPVRTN